MMFWRILPSKIPKYLTCYYSQIRYIIKVPKRGQSNWFCLKSKPLIKNNVLKTSLVVGATSITVILRQIYVAKCSHSSSVVNLNNIAKKESDFDWKWFIELLSSELKLIIGALTAALLAAYLNVKISLCLGDFINVISEMIKQSDIFTLGRLKEPGIRLLTMYILQAMCTFVYISLLSTMGENLAVNLRYELFETMIKQDIAFFDEVRTSTLVDCVISDVQEFKSTFKQSISQGIKSIAQISGGLISLFIISPTMTLSVIVVVPVMIAIGSLFGSLLRQISRKAQTQSLKASAIFEEAISNIRTVRAFANEDLEADYYKNHLYQSRNLNILLGYGIGSFQAGTNICLNGLVLGTLCLGSHLMLHNNIKPGDLMSFMVATQTIQRSFAQLSILFGHSIKGKEALKRIFHICHLRATIPVKGGIIIDEQDFVPKMVFENVSFSYPTRPGQLVLKNLNLTIPAGKTIAVVGTSGNGKTTLVNLLERFYEVNDGMILISNNDIKSLDPHWLRSTIIGIINQEPSLFAASIKDNIRYGKPTASDDEVYEAAKQANAHEFISSFPDGYDTIVGQRGLTISGGQKQRIAIARALLKKPSILILDEATSALDPESEKIVQKTLEKISKGKTVLIIAHRLTTVQNSDLIVVLSKGQVAEVGTHKELCAKKGLYWELMNKPESRYANN